MANSISAAPDVLNAPDAPDALQDLVDANHILFHEGVLDAFGHVSMRCADDPGRFLLSRSMAPALVAAADVFAFDLDGNPVADAAGNTIDGQPPAVFLERFIHSAIYRARPDVMAVVHSHSPAVIPFGVARNVTLRPICHMSGFLARGAPVFEIRDSAGPGSDLLIRDAALGQALAARLGTADVVLMRGHGATVAADSLRQAVYCAIYTEKNARLVLEARRLGDIEYLTDEEGLAAEATNAKQVNRAWDLWKRLARQTPTAWCGSPTSLTGTRGDTR
ncbi:class II aldolase/adducin family protein [Cupriavidus sp. 8B]